jgi:2-methylcitrate dehydratase PrpD
VSDGHRVALADWMACAAGGMAQRAAAAARAAGDGLLERVAWLGTAGHVLDFDDTYLPGIAHLSAPTAPAAIAVGAEVGASVGEVLEAYAAGFEAMGALARASHPGLYDRGWHPTAACGGVGAAVAAARLLGLDAEAEGAAARLALARAGGTRAGFGSDGKALGVGMAAAQGVHAALVARHEPRPVVADAAPAFGEALGGAWVRSDPAAPAVAVNWVKPWPCCLLAHSSIEAALAVRDRAGSARVEVAVHPVARRAAAYDEVADGLQAKFSIPYLTAFALVHGEPGPASFDGVDGAARALAARVTVRVDPGLGEAEAVLWLDGGEAARVAASRGSPARPLSPAELAAKARGLAGDRLDGALDDDAVPARDLLEALAP